jgi:hypothetical protein
LVPRFRWGSRRLKERSPRSKSKLAYLPLSQDDPRQRRPDISLAKECLKWQPTVTLREGLRHTIEYFDELLSTTHMAARASRSPAEAGHHGLLALED